MNRRRRLQLILRFVIRHSAFLCRWPLSLLSTAARDRSETTVVEMTLRRDSPIDYGSHGRGRSCSNDAAIDDLNQEIANRARQHPQFPRLRASQWRRGADQKARGTSSGRY